MNRKSRILVVDDEEIILSLFQRLLGQSCEVKTARNGQEALKLASIFSDFDIIFLDIVLPGISGTEIIQEIKKSSPQGQVVMMTGYPLEEIINDALEAGALRCLIKPIAITDIIETVATVPKTIDIAKYWNYKTKVK